MRRYEMCPAGGNGTPPIEPIIRMEQGTCPTCGEFIHLGKIIDASTGTRELLDHQREVSPEGGEPSGDQRKKPRP